MRIFKAFFISIALYSKIPVPNFEWKKEDMQYSFVFFPWIGAVIGVLLIAWRILCDRLGIGDIAYIAISLSIPLIITGGFHVDGFMDTMDALCSYGDRKKKLEILSDPHIGAFAVIMLLLYSAIMVAAFSEIEGKALVVFAAGFFLSRTLSAFAALTLKCAKSEGLLFQFADSSKGALHIVRAFCIVWFVVCGGFMLYTDMLLGAVAIGASVLVYLYYMYKSKKEFGGITGDTEGWFVCMCELAIAVALSMV